MSFENIILKLNKLIKIVEDKNKVINKSELILDENKKKILNDIYLKINELIKKIEK